jgi:hypothetical protein
MNKPIASYKLRAVEPGYAKVMQVLSSGAEVEVGTVAEAKAGSTRTGTMWTARNSSGRQLGTAYTRTAAVDLIRNRNRSN